MNAEDAPSAPPDPAASPPGSPRGEDARFSHLPFFLFGVHGAAAERQMLAAGKPGWIAIDVAVDSSPPLDCSSHSDLGFGVIACLLGSDRKFPTYTRSQEFAAACAARVAQSKGVRVWVIGDAPNASVARPLPESPEARQEVVTPDLYARLFIECRKAIRTVPGHEQDWVVPAAVAPFVMDTTYPNNPNGDWVRYFADLLFQISTQGGRPDALALHAYTQGGRSDLITSEERSPGENRRRHFRVYRDWLSAVTPALRQLPVLITDAAPLERASRQYEPDWIQRACEEIEAWNATPGNQAIQAICFSHCRDAADDGAAMDDLCRALEKDYRVRWPLQPPIPDHRVHWAPAPRLPALPALTPFNLHVAVANAGAKAWRANGSGSVHVAASWFRTDEGKITEDSMAHDKRADLPRDLLPGQSAYIDLPNLVTPRMPGSYGIEIRLLSSEGGLPQSLGLPSLHVPLTVTPPLIPAFRVEWRECSLPELAHPNELLRARVAVRNSGADIWRAAGDAAVMLIHFWQAEQAGRSGEDHQQRIALARDVRPGGEAEFEIELRAPVPRGKHVLVLRLSRGRPGEVSERRAPINIASDDPDYSAEWLETPSWPGKRLVTGERLRVRVVAANRGALSWQAAGNNALGFVARWKDLCGKEVGVGVQTSLAQDVLPGDKAIGETLELFAPTEPGEYVLVWALAGQGIEWVSGATSETRVAVRRPPLDWGADFAGHTVPTSMAPGQRAAVSLQVENSGRNVWPSKGEHPVSLIGEWLNDAGQPIGLARLNVPLSGGLAPDASAEFACDITAPSAPGVYQLRWDLQREGLGSFAEASNRPLVVRVRVSQAASPINLWRVCASHNSASAWQAIDGDLSTYWSSAAPQTPGMFFQLSFDEAQVVDGIAFRSPGRGYPCSYSISVSPDGEEWRQVDRVEAGNHEDAAAVFAPCTVQAARIELTGGWREEWQISELQIHGSPGWSATASERNEAAHFAIDNDPGTAWSTGDGAQKPNMWFQLDLGQSECIDGLSWISKDGGQPEGLRLTIWNERGGGWQTVAEWHVGGPSEVRFAPIETQYVHIQLLEAAPRPWGISVLEIRRAMTRWISNW